MTADERLVPFWGGPLVLLPCPTPDTSDIPKKGITAMDNSSKNMKTALLLGASSIAMIVLSIMAMIKAPTFSQDLIADPSVGYAPNAHVPDAHAVEWFLGTPVFWVIPILMVLIIVISWYRDGYVILTFTFIISAVFLCIGLMLTNDQTSDTFSTWAEQRYGIEIETLPRTPSTFFSDGTVDTTADVVLDDGQVIGVKKYTDARGNTAYIIVDRASDTSSDELDVITD